MTAPRRPGGGLPVGRLPGPLPAGERLLWQGAPQARALALGALHLPKVAAYFAILLAWYVASSLARGTGGADLAVAMAKLTGLALVPLALISLYAWAVARATVYTITSRRVVIRSGLALPMSVNLPFARIDGAALRQGRGTGGDIALTLEPAARVSWLVLWPHARPWHFGRPQPMLRALPDAAPVAQVLARALAASAEIAVQPAPGLRPAPRASGAAATAAA